MCVWLAAQKLLLQRPVDQHVLCNASRVYVEEETSGVGNPRGSVAGNCNVERASPIVRLNIHGLIRIPVSEYIQAIIVIARDPDVPVCVRSHSLSSDWSSLVAVRL